MNRDVIIALDFPGKPETERFLKRFSGKKPFVKIGMELFYAEGPDIIRHITGAGHKVFLDLKLHDIPNTVKSAMKVLAKLNIDMVNLHAAGTSGMMSAAREGLLEACDKPPLLIAVTQLTSTGEKTMRDELLIERSMEDVVLHYAANARGAGLDGIVCSPLEAASVKRACGSGFITVTPGIRFESSIADDQVRVMTPERARGAGSDYIVVGRPITAAEDPAAAYERCVKEFVGE